MRVQVLSEKTGVSIGRIYQLARKLNRLPTEEEILERKGKVGRPQKYKEKRNVWED
jgi:hypothetical protein